MTDTSEAALICKLCGKRVSRSVKEFMEHLEQVHWAEFVDRVEEMFFTLVPESSPTSSSPRKVATGKVCDILDEAMKLLMNLVEIRTLVHYGQYVPNVLKIGAKERAEYLEEEKWDIPAASVKQALRTLEVFDLNTAISDVWRKALEVCKEEVAPASESSSSMKVVVKPEPEGVAIKVKPEEEEVPPKPTKLKWRRGDYIYEVDVPRKQYRLLYKGKVVRDWTDFTLTYEALVRMLSQEGWELLPVD